MPDSARFRLAARIDHFFRAIRDLGEFSALHPGQPVFAPATYTATLFLLIRVALEAFENVEGIGEAGRGGRRRGAL